MQNVKCAGVVHRFLKSQPGTSGGHCGDQLVSAFKFKSAVRTDAGWSLRSPEHAHENTVANTAGSSLQGNTLPLKEKALLLPKSTPFSLNKNMVAKSSIKALE